MSCGWTNGVSVRAVTDLARQRGSCRDERPVTVLVVDDHLLMAQTLRIALEQRGLEALVLGPRESLAEGLERSHPDVVVLDLDLDESEPYAGLRLISPAVAFGSAVLILTGVRDRRQLAIALEAGACGVIGKDRPVEEVLDGVRRAARGEAVTPVAVREELLDELRCHRREEAKRLGPFEALTQREREVLTMLCAGVPAAAIARDTFVSVTTVRGHINAILRKLGVRSQLTAIAMAKRAGWPGTA